MTRKLTEQYFGNKIEQSKIESAILEAIPAGVYYHNLILALSKVLSNMVERAYVADVYKKDVDKKGGAT